MMKLFIPLLFLSNIAIGQTNIERIIMSQLDNFIGDSINKSPNKAYNKRISLKQIDKSQSKIDIRLYRLLGLSNTKLMRRIYIVDTTWKAQEFDEWNNPVVINKHKLYVNPSFDSLILKLLSYNILTLPPQDSLKTRMKKLTDETDEGYPVYSTLRVNDGYGYTIEIKVGNKFRIYEFDNPEEYSKYYDNVSELKDYVSIVRTFTDYLSKINSR